MWAWVEGVEFRVPGSGSVLRASEIGVRGLWLMISWFVVHGLWIMVYGLVEGFWFRVHGLWLRVSGLGFMVYGL